MAGYIGSVLSSYKVSSLVGNAYSPSFVNKSSALKTGAAVYGSDFATIASDYKALQTKNYDTLSTSYSYLKTVTSPDYSAESPSSTEKADTEESVEKEIILSANQMSQVYAKFASNTRLLDILV